MRIPIPQEFLQGGGRRFERFSFLNASWSPEHRTNAKSSKEYKAFPTGVDGCVIKTIAPPKIQSEDRPASKIHIASSGGIRYKSSTTFRG
jgi:hypothetical protein